MSCERSGGGGGGGGANWLTILINFEYYSEIYGYNSQAQHACQSPHTHPRLSYTVFKGSREIILTTSRKKICCYARKGDHPPSPVPTNQLLSLALLVLFIANNSRHGRKSVCGGVELECSKRGRVSRKKKSQPLPFVRCRLHYL